MATQVINHAISRTQAIQAIMRIRHEWETAVHGDSLVETKGSVGYLLADVAASLGLKGEELRIALGDVAGELALLLDH